MDPFSDRGLGRRRARRRRSSPARKYLLVTAGLSLLVGVVVLTLFVAGGPEDAGTSSDSGAAGSRGEGAAGAVAEPTTGDGRRGGIEGGSAPDGQVPERAQDPDVADGATVGGEVRSSHDGDEEAYVTAPETEGEGGLPWVSEEPAGAHDPLGKDADPDGLTQTERERLRFAAAEFVTRAYGYTGSNPSAYREELAGVMVAPEVYDSPGGTWLKAVEREITAGGTESAAVLTDFEVREPDEDGVVKGVAYFTVGESYEANGVGEKVTDYAQPLNLQGYESSWKVVAADEREEISSD